MLLITKVRYPNSILHLINSITIVLNFLVISHLPEACLQLLVTLACAAHFNTRTYLSSCNKYLDKFLNPTRAL